MFCERTFVLHRQQPEESKHIVDVAPSGKISADAHAFRVNNKKKIYIDVLFILFSNSYTYISEYYFQKSLYAYC